MNNIKAAVFLGLSVFLSAYATNVLSHTYIGTIGALGGPSATDLLRVDCFLDPGFSQTPTHSLFIDINDGTTTGGKLTAHATVYNTGAYGKAVSVTDPKGADGTASVSKLLNVVTLTDVQDVSFYITVSHTDAGAENYLLNYHCQDKFGQHTGTGEPITVLQSQ